MALPAAGRLERDALGIAARKRNAVGRITSSQGQQTRVIAASLASLEAAGLTDTVAALRGNFLRLGKR
jgi:hypothetical protein